MKNFLSLEISGVEDVLDRYMNPINKELYLEVFDFFIKKEYTQMFSFLNSLIDLEQSIEQTDITLSICKTTARESLMFIKKEYGIVLDIDEDEFRINDIVNIMNKLEFLVDVDRDRAIEILEMLNSEDSELEAMTSVLEDIGIDKYFMLEYFDRMEYGYIAEYKDYLNRVIGDSEEEVLEKELKEKEELKRIINKLESLAGSYKIKVLDIVKAREAFAKSKEMLSIINNIDFKSTTDTEASFEFLSVMLLSELRDSESFIDVYRDTIVLGLELGLNREEDIYKILAKNHINILQELKDERERTV